ncbi:MAG: hypothetical protein KAI86_09715, partial [Desulfobacterales bacterium]|nr:hypothetical protein [Desulfobacterales bacterium]
NRGVFEGSPSELPGRSQEVSGNRHPQMNDRCLARGNLIQEQDSAYELLWPFFFSGVGCQCSGFSPPNSDLTPDTRHLKPLVDPVTGGQKRNSD